MSGSVDHNNHGMQYGGVLQFFVGINSGDILGVYFDTVFSL